MQNCPACGVRIDGQRARCPLCGRNLANAPAEEESTGVFPVVKPRRIYDLAFKISTFAAILILVVLNILRGLWLKEMPLHIYLILTFAVVCAWIIVNVGMRKLGNIAKGILWEGSSSCCSACRGTRSRAGTAGAGAMCSPSSPRRSPYSTMSWASRIRGGSPPTRAISSSP